MASVSQEDGDVGFQIAPMVDVVFVLMLFFMASAGAQVVELELGINLPSGAKGATDSPVVPILIDISPDGTVSRGGTMVDTPDSKDLPELTAFLRTSVEVYGGKDPVIIRPSPDVIQERVIDVLNAAAAAGVRNLTFN